MTLSLPRPLPWVDAVTPVPVRYYQEEATAAVASFYDQGRRHMVVEMPTGAGKTFFVWHLLQWFYSEGWYDARALIVLPSIELVRQTYRSARAFFPEGMLGLVQAEQNILGRPITIASVDTLALPGRLSEVVASVGGRNRFTFTALDEAHGALSSSYATILEVLEHPYALRIGVTATPIRQDGRSLLRVFPDGLAYYVDLLDLIAEGYLVRVTPYAIETDLDLEGVDLSVFEQSGEEGEGGVASSQQAERLARSNRYAKAYAAWTSILEGERTLLFADSVKDAYAFHKHFCEYDAPSEVVTGMMSDVRRAGIYERYHEDEGDVRIICNFGVLTTGVDFIRTRGIIVARSSLMGEHPNRGLHSQVVGRGLRLSDERDEEGQPVKKDCKVVYLIPRQKKGERPPILMSWGMLPGTLEDPPRPLSARPEKGEEIVQEEMELAGDAQPPPPAEIALRLKRLRAATIDIFAGAGWEQHPTGEFSRATELGTLIAERAGLSGEYQVFLRYSSGMTRCIVPEPCEAALARARGTHYVERKLEEQKMRQGVPTARSLAPATEGQLKMLRQRRVPIKGERLPTQGDVWSIVAYLEKHGGNFRPGVEAIGWNGRSVYTWDHTQHKKANHRATTTTTEKDTTTPASSS